MAKLHTCSCGRVFLCSGLGRHRVYWEKADLQKARPLMDKLCSACGRELSGSNG